MGCAVRCASISSPGRQCTRSAISLHMVPEGRNSAASLPSSSATASWSSLTVGSSPFCSSPTSASHMKRRISRVGFVTVSLCRSIWIAAIRVLPRAILTRMNTHALYLVRMDVAHDHEALFNEVYDKEHLPSLRGVPGVRSAHRYRQPSASEPRYIAAYELDSAAVLTSPAWKAAGEAGRWAGEIRPFTMSRHLATYEWAGGGAALPNRDR